jgi:bifunctional DNase/RNase
VKPWVGLHSTMLIKVGIKRVVTTPSACAVFLGDGQKTFVIYVGSGVGLAISMTIEKVKKIRPLTHDLLKSILAGLGVSVDRVVINDLRGNTFYARLFLREESERGKRIVELDARPSDSIVIATQNNAPIYVESHVMDCVEDVSHLLAEEGEWDEFKDE